MAEAWIVSSVVLLAKLLIIYAAARWDYSEHRLSATQHPSYQQYLEAAALLLGTLYLCFPSLLLACIRSGILSTIARELPADFSLAVAIQLLAAILLALKPVRLRLMRFLHLEPDRLLHVLLLYYIASELLSLGAIFERYLPYTLCFPPFHFGSSSTLARAFSQIEPLLIVLIAAGFTSKESWKWKQATHRLGLRRKFQARTVGVIFAALSFTLFLNWLRVRFYSLFDSLGLAFPTVPIEGTPELPLLQSLMIGVIGAPITEEIFYRGLLQPRLGILATSLLFTLAHTQYGVGGLTQVFLIALVYGWMAKHYGLWAAILLHALSNLLTELPQLLPRGYTLLLSDILTNLGAMVCAWLVLRWSYRRYKARRSVRSSFLGPDSWQVALLGSSIPFVSILYWIFLAGSSHASARLVFATPFLILAVFLLLPVARRKMMLWFFLKPTELHHVLIFYSLYALAACTSLALYGPAAPPPWAQQPLIEHLYTGVTQGLLLGFIAAVGLGWGRWRSRSEVVQRLTLLRRPPKLAWGIAPLAALVLVAVAYAARELYAEVAAQQWGEAVPAVQVAWRAYDGNPWAVFGTLMAILLITAGHELLFRGALQPRLGVLRTTFLAALNAAMWSYSFYGLGPPTLTLLLSWVSNLGLGWLAQRYGIWASWVTHTCMHLWIFLWFVSGAAAVPLLELVSHV